MSLTNLLSRPILGVLVLALSLGTAPSASAQACPQTDNSAARGRLEFYFTQARFAEARSTNGLPANGHLRARVASDAAGDAWICDYLRSRIHVPALLAAPWIYTIYEVDGRYYLVWVKGPVSQTRVRIENGAVVGEFYRAPFLVYDGLGGELDRAMF